MGVSGRRGNFSHRFWRYSSILFLTMFKTWLALKLQTFASFSTWTLLWHPWRYSGVRWKYFWIVHNFSSTFDYSTHTKSLFKNTSMKGFFVKESSTCHIKADIIKNLYHDRRWHHKILTLFIPQIQLARTLCTQWTLKEQLDVYWTSSQSITRWQRRLLNNKLILKTIGIKGHTDNHIIL